MSRELAKQILLPLLAGLLSFASFPKIDLSCLAWVSTATLAVFVCECHSVRAAFWGGLLAGAVERGCSLIWIPPVMTAYGGLHPAAAWGAFLPLVAMLGLFPAAVCAATRLSMNRMGERLLLAFPFIWVAMEYALSVVPFGGFPWLLSGYSQTRYVRAVQIADLAGIYIVSFLLLWFNTSLAWIYLRRSPGSGRYWPFGLALALVAASLLYGNVELRHWNAVKPEWRVAMIQENLSVDEDWQTLRLKFLEGYRDKAARLSPGDTDLVILPEAPSPVSFEQDAEYRESMRELAARFKLGLVFNNVAYEASGGEPRYFNSAYFMGRGGQVTGRYDKIHLVPFGEYIPLKRLLGFAQTITRDVGGFSPGSEYRTVDLGSRPVNAIICFEAVFPQIEREFVRRGSQLIINLTNDRWYGTSAAPYQHLLMSRWRAIENRRYLLRATNSGISAVIEPSGRVQTQTAVLSEGDCLGRFAFVEESSFYSRHGDWFAILCAIITVALLVLDVFAGVFWETGNDRRTA